MRRVEYTDNSGVINCWRITCTEAKFLVPARGTKSTMAYRVVGPARHAAYVVVTVSWHCPFKLCTVECGGRLVQWRGISRCDFNLSNFILELTVIPYYPTLNRICTSDGGEGGEGGWGLGDNHELINYLDTKTKCRYLKKLTCKRTL